MLGGSLLESHDDDDDDDGDEDDDEDDDVIRPGSKSWDDIRAENDDAWPQSLL